MKLYLLKNHQIVIKFKTTNILSYWIIYSIKDMKYIQMRNLDYADYKKLFIFTHENSYDTLSSQNIGWFTFKFIIVTVLTLIFFFV